MKRMLTLALVKVALVFVLVGCGRRGARPPGEPIPGTRSPSPGLHDGPAGILHWLSLGASALAGIGLILCAIAAVFSPDKWRVAKAAVVCVAVLLISQAIYWLSQHIVLATFAGLLVVVLGVLGWGFVNRKALEVRWRLDLDRDGKIGK